MSNDCVLEFFSMTEKLCSSMHLTSTAYSCLLGDWTLVDDLTCHHLCKFK